MEEKYKHKFITFPNLLSSFRLLLIPVIVWLYVLLLGVCSLLVDPGKAYDKSSSLGGVS